MATIFCFSSTGNSLSAAKKIADRIGGVVIPMSGEPVDCSDDVIGFVFPVYFWGLPRIVMRFVENIHIKNKDVYVFAVITCGGPVFGVLGYVKSLLKSKNNIRLSYSARVVTVCNYSPEYDPHDSEELRKRVDDELLIIADAVNNRKTKRTLAVTFFNRLAYKRLPDENSDRYFTVTSACTGCMTCQKVCPSRNITVESGKPVFHHKCEHCLACLHHCPARAIDWKEKTIGRQRYKNIEIPLEELIAFNNHDN